MFILFYCFRRPLLEERPNYVDLLFHYLLCDGNSAAFMQYMNVRKGRTLTKRALPYLDKVQSVGIVSLVCKNLQQLMKKDQADEVQTVKHTLWLISHTIYDYFI